MKKVLIVILFFVSFQTEAQLTIKSGRYSYNKTSRLNGSQTELYNKANLWVWTNFDENKSIIKSNEEDREMIIQSSVEHEMGGMPNVISFTYKIEFLGGMYKETFTDLVYKSKGKELPYENRKVSGKKGIMNDTYDMMELISLNLSEYVQNELIASE